MGRFSTMKRKNLWIAVAACCGTLAAGTLSTTALAATKPMPALTGWNLDNAKTSLVEEKTWLYPSQAARDADTNNIGAGSTGYVIWELDDDSGEAPGIQVRTNEPVADWGLRNCIMASGTDKVCGDDQGSSKRFKLRVTGSQAAPVDLVFNVADDQVFTYDNALIPGDIITSRIYRVLMKWANFTDLRAQGFKVEVGFGTGASFVPASATGAEGIAFELSTTVTRASLGEAGGGQDREVWKPLEFATFSPSMYTSDDPDTVEVETGFFDNQVAGLIPPQVVNSQYIYSGEALVGSIVGATTQNYYGQWGYLLNQDLLPTGYYQDNDGVAATEGFLIAWLDTSATLPVWRDRNGVEVPQLTLDAWAAAPLSEDEVLLPLPRYEQAPIDDLAGLNVDVYLKLAEGYNPAVAGQDKITLRLTPVAPGGSITPVVDGGGGGGCAIGGSGRFDPTLPALAAAGLVFFGLRRFKAGK